jgi:hypothetical protein
MNAKETAAKLGTGVRAVQIRARRGTLPATLIDGVWRFNATAVDRIAKGAK